MTTQELESVATTYQAPTTYSEIIRDEVRAECGRRGISQRRLGRAMGISQASISDRASGRIPWTLDEVERLERVLGLDRGALLFRCARRDSNPQPSDLSPLQVLLGVVAVTACWECRELGCGGPLACDCGCHDEIDEYDDLVATTAAATSCTGWCGREGCTENYLVPCECPCHGDIADLVATTAAAAWELAA